MLAEILKEWDKAADAFALPDPDKTRCRAMLNSYWGVAEQTARDIWNEMSLQVPVGEQSGSSVAHMRFLGFGSGSPLRRFFYNRVRAHAVSLNQLSEESDVFFEMLKLNNETSKALWIVLSFYALGAERNLSDNTNQKATTAFVLLFDLARHGLYFAFMTRLTGWSVPSDGQPINGSELSNLWQASVPDYYAAKGEGRDVVLARYIKRIVRDISTPKTYEGGACLVPFFVRLSFRTHLSIEADPTEIQLKKLSDFYLAMVRIPVLAVFDAKIPNMALDIGALCDDNRSKVDGGIQEMQTQIHNALDRRNATYTELRKVHDDLSACSIPIATYNRVCDTTWLCCTLTLKRSGNQQANDTTSSLLESIEQVPTQVKSWTAFFRSILTNDVYSSSGREPKVSSAYNSQMKEYILVISVEQFIKDGEKRALDRKIATRNVRGTLLISDDHAQFFGERGFRCVRERWAFSHKPLQADLAGVVFPTITMGKMIDLVSDSKDCFQAKFGNEIRLLGTLRSEIDDACTRLDDPIESNIFNIQALFIRESTYESVTAVGSLNGTLTATQVIESKLDDANNPVTPGNLLFEGQDLDGLANNQYFAIVSSYLNQHVAPMYLEEWKRTELAVIDPKYFEWNLRTSKYREKGRASSLCLNNALTNMVALNNSRSLAVAVSPARASAPLAECIGEIRTVYTGIKAALSILSPLVIVLERQSKIQSKSVRVGRRGVVSDVTTLRRLVLSLVGAVFKIDKSLSRQHLRVCDACESLHGRLESSIPSGKLIDRIRNTLETVKTVLKDGSVLSVLQSINVVCEALRASGNLGSHATRLTRAYDWIPDDNNFVFTNLEIDQVIVSIHNQVEQWDRVYDNYRDLVVGVFLHAILSKEEIVSVSIPRSDAVSTDSSNRSSDNKYVDAMVDQGTVAQNEERRRQWSEDDATVDLPTQWTRLNSLYAEYINAKNYVVEYVNAVTNTVNAYRMENRSMGNASTHTPKETEFLDRDGPADQSDLVVKVDWIERAHTIMTPIDKSTTIARLRNKFNTEYDTFKNHYNGFAARLCRLLLTISALYDGIPKKRDALFDKVEGISRNLLNFYAGVSEADGGLAHDVSAAMETLVQTTMQQRENLQTDANPMESAHAVLQALSNVSLSMEVAGDSDAKRAWHSSIGSLENDLNFIVSVSPTVKDGMPWLMGEFAWLFGNIDDDAPRERIVNMLPSIGTLLKECFLRMRRVKQLLSIG